MPLDVPSEPGPALHRLPAIEDEVDELERQVGAVNDAGTDFAIRIDRRSTTLIATVDELRSAVPAGARGLPQNFWGRTADAITKLTAVRKAARAVLGGDS